MATIGKLCWFYNLEPGLTTLLGWLCYDSSRRVLMHNHRILKMHDLLALIMVLITQNIPTFFNHLLSNTLPMLETAIHFDF